MFRADGSSLQNLNSTFVGISSGGKVMLREVLIQVLNRNGGNAFTEIGITLQPVSLWIVKLL